jgi:hypothetical protein
MSSWPYPITAVAALLVVTNGEAVMVKLSLNHKKALAAPSISRSSFLNNCSSARLDHDYVISIWS